MASRGFTGLWLIGLWERSRASQRIKQLRGNPEAVASAYSLYDYEIAHDLGGQEAYERLRDRAWARGIRLATDMVPNHMGVDSRWVIERPDWFISLPDPPYPSYSFNGPDLSSDDRVTIQIEDHYYDNSDAAVVFKRYDHGSGETRYVYHGNDGTSTPWNDTAQLNYLRADVRESVIQTILAVARRSPIIRFDAAMTLAKRHIERLWYPEPGHGGAIPSRAEHALPKAEFERLMPVEFWREVVDRVAAEVPDTLLLAEAFWLMEGYFVRTLGMHRVYNSAFMHMLRDEQNAEYRTLLKTTLEFDPEILKRYVNFMTNPDERTAVDQFGKGDKYFGVATVLATLPGLPLFGHGQIDGFAEKYGMEYRRAYRDEQPDPWLVERHEREIVPLLHRRGAFAEVGEFLLYDFVADDGAVNEDVFAYSNRSGGERSLVVYHNRYASARGRIRESVSAMARSGDGGGRELGRSTLAAGLGLDGGDDVFLAMRDERTGMEFLRSAREVQDEGLWFDLHAYDCRVFLRIREVRDSPSWPVARLAGELSGRGVPNLDEAMRSLLLRPIQEPARRLFDPERVRRLREAATSASASGRAASPPSIEDVLGGLGPDAAVLLAAITERSPIGGPAGDARSLVGAPARVIDDVRNLAALVAGPGPAVRAKAGPPLDLDPLELLRQDDPTWLAMLAAAVLRSLAEAVAGAAAGPTARAWVDDYGLAAVLVDAARGVGVDESESWRTLEGIRGLLTAPTWRSPGDAAASDGSRHPRWPRSSRRGSQTMRSDGSSRSTSIARSAGSIASRSSASRRGTRSSSSSGPAPLRPRRVARNRWLPRRSGRPPLLRPFRNGPPLRHPTSPGSWRPTAPSSRSPTGPATGWGSCCASPHHRLLPSRPDRADGGHEREPRALDPAARHGHTAGQRRPRWARRDSNQPVLQRSDAPGRPRAAVGARPRHVRGRAHPRRRRPHGRLRGALLRPVRTWPDDDRRPGPRRPSRRCGPRAGRRRPRPRSNGRRAAADPAAVRQAGAIGGAAPQGPTPLRARRPRRARSR